MTTLHQDLDRTELKVSIRVALQRQANVMHAVMLRDIRSRFFNHGLGFLVQPLFPVGHVVMLLAIYTFMNRAAVFGDDITLYFATGLVPVLTMNYVSRFMAVSLLANKGMLAFPAVHLMDIVLARALLEFPSMFISIMIMAVILMATGVDSMPHDPAQAALCMAVTAYLAIGLGIIISVLAAIYPLLSLLYAMLSVLIYLSSGGPIYLNALPSEYVYWLSFSPGFQVVTWMRSAYYQGYPTEFLDKTYLIMWALVSVCTGLMLERSLRKYVLNG